MAKDPAFLFYPGDWLGGTMLFTRHQKGCYIDLLMAQFNSGPLTLDQIKTVLGQDQAIWTVLQAKFKIDNNGMFYNEKLATEIEKRKNFVATRSNGKSGRKKSHDLSHDFHMNNHTEDGNRNENKVRKKKGGTGGKKPEFEFKIEMPFGETFQLHWDKWKAYKKNEHKFNYKSLESEQAAISSLVELAKDSEETAIAIINQSMAHGWKGFFELKKINQNGTDNRNSTQQGSVKNFNGTDYSQAL